MLLAWEEHGNRTDLDDVVYVGDDAAEAPSLPSRRTTPTSLYSSSIDGLIAAAGNTRSDRLPQPSIT